MSVDSAPANLRVTTVRLSKAQQETLDFLVSELGLTQSEAIRQLLPTREQAQAIVAKAKSGRYVPFGKVVSEVAGRALSAGLGLPEPIGAEVGA